MAKNKKSVPKLDVQVNDKNYLKSGRARKLPIYKCLINENWKETALAHVFVARQHVNGNVTLGVYLIDIYCLGVKDTFYRFNTDEWELDKLTDGMMDFSGEKMVECDYNLAHNIIFGAMEFADEFGIAPDKEFEVTQMILEEDDENIPLMDIEFGRDGMPVLIGELDDPKTKHYLSLLKKNAGEGNFEFEPFDFEDDEFEEDEDEDEDFDDPEDFDYDDWKELINGTAADLVRNMAVNYYVYDKVIAISKVGEDKYPINITYDVVETPYNKTGVEREETEACYVGMTSDPTANELIELERRVKAGIERWPENPVFWGYLVNVCNLQDKVLEAKETLELLVEKFPDYFFGKLLLAADYLTNKEPDKVPGLLNNAQHLHELYPDRTIFHISEFAGFESILAWYYLEKGDIDNAVIHRERIFDYSVEDIMLNKQLMMRLDITVLGQVELYLKKVRGNKSKVDALITTLMA